MLEEKIKEIDKILAGRYEAVDDSSNKYNIETRNQILTLFPKGDEDRLLTDEEIADIFIDNDDTLGKTPKNRKHWIRAVVKNGKTIKEILKAQKALDDINKQKEMEYYREGFAEFRQGIRSAIYPYWANNPCVDDSEIIDGIKRLVKDYQQHQKEIEEILPFINHKEDCLIYRQNYLNALCDADVKRECNCGVEALKAKYNIGGNHGKKSIKESC